jgi:uncharacterized Rmd1/YagE family protein
MRCSAYCTAQVYKIDNLAQHLASSGLAPKMYPDALHVEIVENGKPRVDVFYFSYGSVVIWGSDFDFNNKCLKELKAFEEKPYKVIADDIMQFAYDSTQETHINDEEDRIILESEDPLIKLSISFALAQTVKLDVFEASILNIIEETRHIAYELYETGKVSISREKLTKYIGKLFAERNIINLNSDLLDTPEFFWRRPKYEPYYLSAYESFDIDHRHSILNNRLNVIHDLYSRLSDELNHRHSSNLEIIIIYLISVEVLVVILKDILHLL